MATCPSRAARTAWPSADTNQAGSLRRVFTSIDSRGCAMSGRPARPTTGTRSPPNRLAIARSFAFQVAFGIGTLTSVAYNLPGDRLHGTNRPGGA